MRDGALLGVINQRFFKGVSIIYNHEGCAVITLSYVLVTAVSEKLALMSKSAD